MVKRAFVLDNTVVLVCTLLHEICRPTKRTREEATKRAEGNSVGRSSGGKPAMGRIEVSVVCCLEYP